MKRLFNNLVKIAGVFFLAGCATMADKAESRFPSSDIEMIVQDEMSVMEGSFITIGGDSYKIDSVDPIGAPSEDKELVLFLFDNNRKTLFADMDIRKRSATVLILSGNTSDKSEEEIEELLENPLFRGDFRAVQKMERGMEWYVFRGKLLNTRTQEMVEASFPYNNAISGIGDTRFDVQGDEVIVNGTLGTRAYVQMKDVIENHPEVRTVVLDQVPGSINDFVNMHTGFLLRDAGLNTKVLSTSDVNSGGVDLFAAGVKRIAEKGAILGIHSWCCSDDGKPADKLSRDDPAHQDQLTYYKRVLGEKLGPGFYFFTLNASSFDGIHPMTKEEMLQWNLVTDYIE